MIGAGFAKQTPGPAQLNAGARAGCIAAHLANLEATNPMLSNHPGTKRRDGDAALTWHLVTAGH
jgi:hypothetical protein